MMIFESHKISKWKKFKGAQKCLKCRIKISLIFQFEFDNSEKEERGITFLTDLSYRSVEFPDFLCGLFSMKTITIWTYLSNQFSSKLGIPYFKLLSMDQHHFQIIE